MPEPKPDLERLREALEWVRHQPYAEAFTAAQALSEYLRLMEGPTDDKLREQRHWEYIEGAIEADVDEDGFWTMPAVKTTVDFITDNEPRVSILIKPGRYLVVPVADTEGGETT